MASTSEILDRLPELLGESLRSCHVSLDEITCDVTAADIRQVCQTLRDNPLTHCEQLIDLCGVDYSDYGKDGGEAWSGDHYAVIYHLLSLHHNRRIRIRAGLSGHQPTIDSVIDVWPAADWFEREAFDLFGIIFVGHPDLRRLLTDYGFIGHPFRKDFPLSGKVEMRYDEAQGRVIYQPVTIEPRTLVPRTIRKEAAVIRPDGLTNNEAG